MIPSDSQGAAQLVALYDLVRRARLAESTAELGFLLANNTHALAPFRQAALWLAEQGMHTLSGVVLPDANAPYVQWTERVCAHLAETSVVSFRTVSAADLPTELAGEWVDWWPEHALWLAMPANTSPVAGLLLVRDTAWSEQEQAQLREWADAWWHAFKALHRPAVWSLNAWRSKLAASLKPAPSKPWWRQASVRWTTVVLIALVFPVRLSVLAPGELVPANPVVIRAPLDGVVEAFHVQPNETVKNGQDLFGFDEALIQSRLEVAEQSLATAETEYRQTTQQALVDAKYRTQLALLTGKIEERRAETDFLRGQLQRSRVQAPQDGVALFDDPSEWIGKPVVVGERIMRIAAPTDSEVEAWLPLADAVELAPGAPVTLYLSASPLAPVSARVRYMAHDAVQRPDGSYAYRVRAKLDEENAHRVGLKGTAKLHAGWVPLGYWVLRRPLASLRTTLGI